MRVPPYTPRASFWIIGGDASRAWSTSAKAYVSEFLLDVAHPVKSESELREVLTNAGCPELAPGFVPASVALWKARAALESTGLLASADAAVAASGNPAVKAAWEYATELQRDSPAIVGLASALGLSSAQLDALFIQAAAIEV